MSEFTKGPWTIHGSYVYAPDRQIIAVVQNPGRTEADYPLVANARLIAAAPEMFAELAKWAAIDCDHYPYPPCCEADCLTCSARALHARIVQFGPHAHAGVWISRETSDKISSDGP